MHADGECTVQPQSRQTLFAGAVTLSGRAGFAEVEPVHRTAEIEITIGVEAANEAPGVALEVAFDLEFQPERVIAETAVGVQAHAPEAAIPLQRRAVGDDAQFARHAHTGLGIRLVGVVAVVPVRIEPDRFALQRADRDRERQRTRGAGNIDVAVCGARKALQQGQRDHAAHRVADHAGEAYDTQAADHVHGGIGAVFHRQIRETEPVSLACNGVDRCGAGRSLAAAQRIHADHEPAVGVDGFAVAQHRFPPARFAVVGVARDVGVGRQPGENQDGIVAGGVERPPGFIGHARAVQRAAAFHREHCRQGCEAGTGGNEFCHP